MGAYRAIVAPQARPFRCRFAIASFRLSCLKLLRMGRLPCCNSSTLDMYPLQHIFSKMFSISLEARNIIIDTRRTSLDDGEIEKAVIRETKRHSTVRRVILVDKSEKIVEMSI